LILPAFFPSSARAQPRCGLSLVLALDVSSSVDEGEFDLQMQGLAGALRDPEIVQAIVGSGGIQVMAFEWSGRFQQVEVAPWSYLSTEADVLAFAGVIAGHRRGFDDFPTALGYALGHAATRLSGAPLNCARKVVDMSGDGITNEGFGPAEAYDAFDFDGVTVNGLVIEGEYPDPVIYYREQVIRGPGAFIEIARDFSDYEDAMRRKLLREINGAALSFLSRP